MQCTGRQMRNKTGKSLGFVLTVQFDTATFDWNWNVKPIVHFSKFFYCVVSMLAKTINECENKSWVHNTEMPLALVSPHLCCLKHHVYFFLNLFVLNFKKKKREREEHCYRGSAPVWLHRLYTVTTKWTCMKYAHRNIITLKWQQIREWEAERYVASFIV